MTPSGPLPQANPGAGIGVGLAAAVAVLLIGGGLAWSLTGPHVSAAGRAIQYHEFLFSYLPHITKVWSALPLKLQSAIAIVAAFAAIAGIWLGWLASRPGPALVHESGGQLREGAAGAKGATSREKDFIFEIAGIRFSLDRLRRSIFAVGSIGGGKTQALYHFLLGLIRAGFRLLIVDGPKGDYSSSLPTDDLVIIAPWHAGPAWDIARDCPTRQHAVALARALIPVSEKDPIWGNAAGAVLVAAACKLIHSRAAEWDWRDLYAEATRDLPELYETARKYYPPAVESLRDAESKTTQSIMINLATFLLPVYELALAWGGKREKISLVDWWIGKTKGPQVVVLQMSAEFSSLSASYISAAIVRLAMLTASPSFPESKTRKNVIVIDEFAQLPKIAGFEKFLEIGRSKGCSVIAATQSFSQIQKIWGREDMTSWLAMIGTKIFARTGGADDVALVQREIGTRRILLPSHSSSTSESAGRSSGGSQSVGWQREERAIVSQSDLAELGPDQRAGGVRVMMAGFGSDVIRVLLPFVTWPARRPAYVENPNWNRIVPTGAAGDQAEERDPADPARIPPHGALAGGNPLPAASAQSSSENTHSESVDSLLADLTEPPMPPESYADAPADSPGDYDDGMSIGVSDSGNAGTDILGLHDNVATMTPDYTDDAGNVSAAPDQSETQTSREDTERRDANLGGEVFENLASAAIGIDLDAIKHVAEVAENVTAESPESTSVSSQSAPKANTRLQRIRKKMNASNSLS